MTQKASYAPEGAPAAPSDTDGNQGWVDHFDEYANNYAEVAFGNPGLLALARDEERAVLAAGGNIKGADVLDAGCGFGRLSEKLVARGATVTALDGSEQMLARCAQRVPEATQVQAVLGEPLPFADDSFDVVFCMRVIKYLEDWRPALAEFRRVLRPGGRLVLEVTNSRSVARYGYKGAPIHICSIPEAQRRVRQAGFGIDTTEGLTRLPFPIWQRADTSSAGRRVGALDRAINSAAAMFGLENFGSRSAIISAVLPRN